MPIIAAAKALQDELLGPAPPADRDDSLLADERRAVEAFKKAALMVLGLAMQTYGEKLADQQEVLMHLADMLIDVYSAESAVASRTAAAEADRPDAALHVDAARVFVNDAAMRIEASARQALAAMVDGDTLGRCWRRSGGCSRSRRSTRSSCGGDWPTRPWRRAVTFSVECD